MISQDILDKATSETINFGESIQESILGSSNVFNKRSGLYWILKQIPIDQNEDNQVKRNLEYLENNNNLSVIVLQGG